MIYLADTNACERFILCARPNVYSSIDCWSRARQEAGANIPLPDGRGSTIISAARPVFGGVGRASRRFH